MTFLYWHNCISTSHTSFCNWDVTFKYAIYLSIAWIITGCFPLSWLLKISREFVEKDTILRLFESFLLIQIWCVFLFVVAVLLFYCTWQWLFFYTYTVLMYTVYNPFALEALLHDNIKSGWNYFSLTFRLHFSKIWWNPLLENRQDWQPWKLKTMFISGLDNTA